MALNQTAVLFRLNVVEFAFRLPIFVVGAVYFGVAGIVAARLVTALAVAACSAVAARELIGLSLRTQVFNSWRPVVSGLAMALAIVPMADWLADVRGLLPLILGLTAVGFVAGVVYAGSIFTLWRLAGCPDGFESKIAKVVGSYKGRVVASGSL
jgi:PST family polysaccharide transporter